MNAHFLPLSYSNINGYVKCGSSFLPSMSVANSDHQKLGLPKMKLGSQGFQVSLQGLGCGVMYDFHPKPDNEMIFLIRHAVSKGVTFLDTADIYGPFTNETLVGKAIKGIRDQVQLCTKFGTSVVDGKILVRGDPAFVRASCEASLKRLDVDFIDLYYPHRVDTSIPIEITVGEMKKLVDEGKVRHIGLCEASVDTIRRAHAIYPISAVQIEWSLWSRDVEDEIVPTCRELGIGIVSYSPLGRGFLSCGTTIVESLTDDLKKRLPPRFQAENLEKNKKIFKGLSNIASTKGCSPSQLALSWIHHRGGDVVPIPRTTKVNNLEDNIKALHVKLTDKEMREMETMVSNDVSGQRCSDAWKGLTWRYANTPPL